LGYNQDMETTFRIGDLVEKISGYQFPGTIVAVFFTAKGDIRYVVEMEHFGLLHIFNEQQLAKRMVK
jgi:hypothetical protein